MASITGLGKIGLPRLSENMDPDDARALRNYLYQMQEQLQYVLSNLDTEKRQFVRGMIALCTTHTRFWRESCFSHFYK